MTTGAARAIETDGASGPRARRAAVPRHAAALAPGGSEAFRDAVIMSFNSRVRAHRRPEGAVLVDVYPAFETDLNRYIGLDGLHPTEAGYQKLAELFFDAIRSDLEGADERATTAVRATALTRTFGARVAVSDLSLSLHAGEIVALLGPNGAGKTTTLRMLAGLIPPSIGEITLLGRTLTLEHAPTSCGGTSGCSPSRPDCGIG